MIPLMPNMAIAAHMAMARRPSIFILVSSLDWAELNSFAGVTHPSVFDKNFR
jgi:hypothetical protein